MDPIDYSKYPSEILTKIAYDLDQLLSDMRKLRFVCCSCIHTFTNYVTFEINYEMDDEMEISFKRDVVMKAEKILITTKNMQDGQYSGLFVKYIGSSLLALMGQLSKLIEYGEVCLYTAEPNYPEGLFNNHLSDARTAVETFIVALEIAIGEASSIRQLVAQSLLGSPDVIDEVEEWVLGVLKTNSIY